MLTPKHLEPLIFKKFTKDGKTYKIDLTASNTFMLENINDREDRFNTNSTTNAKKIEFILNKIKQAGYEAIN